jgi:hypothetical protein
MILAVQVSAFLPSNQSSKYSRKLVRTTLLPEVPHAVDPKPLALASKSALSWTPFRIHPRAFAPSYGLFLLY